MDGSDQDHAANGMASRQPAEVEDVADAWYVDGQYGICSSRQSLEKEVADASQQRKQHLEWQMARYRSASDGSLSACSALARPNVVAKKSRIESSQMVNELDANPADWKTVNSTAGQPKKDDGTRFASDLPAPESVAETAARLVSAANPAPR